MTKVSAACAALLARGQAYGPVYRGRLANHLPMALIALDRLGADADKQGRFFLHYSARLEPVAATAGVADPRACLGTGTGFAAVERYFRQRVGQAGSHEVVREWLPVLLPGVAASAFHALIRLAYALDAGIEDEVAAALAYWVTEHAPLSMPDIVTDDDLPAIASRLACAVQGYVFKPGIIVDRMRELVRHPALASVGTHPERLNMRDLAGFAIGEFWRQDDFTLLHIVTACHAARLVLPHAPDPQGALRWLWQAVLAAYLTVRHVPGGSCTIVPGGAVTPDELKRACLDSCDDHQIKLCYSALCEYDTYQDSRYLAVAARALGLAEWG